MGDTLKIAGVYVLWHGKVLVHKRSDKAGSEASWHKFASPGGKVDAEDEGSFRKAALRELKEETGLEVSAAKLRVLWKESNERATSVMYWVKLSENHHPQVTGPDTKSKKSFDMKFDFAEAGVKGEVAGPGYFWAEVGPLVTFLQKHPTYSNPYFTKNIRRLRKAAGAKTRKQ